jgi:hypothetical protein
MDLNSDNTILKEREVTKVTIQQIVKANKKITKLFITRTPEVIVQITRTLSYHTDY